MSTTLAFQRLSQSTTVYNPPTDTISSSDLTTENPTTILICGWMGGTTRNLTRYTTQYHALYPTARMILVTSILTDTPGFNALISPTELKTRPESAVKALLAGGKNGDERLLVHAFSNGGGMTLAAIAKAYKRMAGGPLPAYAVVFDSLPGGDKWTNEFGRWVKAITIGLPSNPLIRWPGKVMVVLIVFALLVVPSLFGLENAATKARRDLNDKSLINSGAKRLYIYSEADALIGANEVREYAAESAAKGWDVEAVNFGSSGHVRHAITDPERYWEAVSKTWKSSVA